MLCTIKVHFLNIYDNPTVEMKVICKYTVRQYHSAVIIVLYLILTKDPNTY